ncbi:MAG: TIGR04076 family protein [Deltaproteobacteria bacterium]|nr:TIGR04076 family protein [Deltaproteobacteria bacterium]
MGALIITVREIRGHCPVYRAGDRIVLDHGYRLNLRETDNLCLHSVSSIMPYYVALYRGVDPRQLGLSKDGKKAFVQCLDPCDYTGGGTVVFEIERHQ